MPTPRDPLKLLSAILTGLVLGFFAVLLAPRILPSQDRATTLAHTDAASNQPQARPHAVKPAPPARQAQKAQPPAPAPQEDKAPSKENGPPAASAPAKEATSEPAKEKAPSAPPLIPASAVRPASSPSAGEMTAALQPLLSFKIDGDDVKRVKEAFDAAARDDDDDARAAIKKIVSPSAKNFAEWKRLRRAEANLQEGMAFRLAHPLYPDLPQDGTSEKALFLANAPAEAVLKYYGSRLPLTGVGHASLGGALAETGQRERGLAMIRFAWGRYTFDPAVEEKFRSRFGALLSEADHRRRERLLAAHAALKEDPGKDTEARGRGFRAALKARAKRGRNAPHRALHHNRRRHSDSRDGSPRLREAAGPGKAGTLGVTSLAEPVRYRLSGRKPATGEGKDEKGAGQGSGDPPNQGRRQRFQALQAGQGRAGHAACAA